LTQLGEAAPVATVPTADPRNLPILLISSSL
jgi:hypothetical protein